MFNFSADRLPVAIILLFSLLDFTVFFMVDVDILLYDDLILQPEIDLPRAEILKFPFVLFPLAEIAGDVIHPIEKISFNEIVASTELDKTSITEVKHFPQESKE